MPYGEEGRYPEIGPVNCDGGPIKVLRNRAGTRLGQLPSRSHCCGYLSDGLNPFRVSTPRTPFSTAPPRSASVASAPVKSAPVRSAPARSAPDKLAPISLAPVRFAKRSSARPRSAPEKSAPDRLAPERSGGTSQLRGHGGSRKLCHSFPCHF